MNPRELVRRLAMQEDLNFLLTNRIPRHALTRFIGRFSRIRQPLIRDLSIGVWKLFTDLDLSDARKQRFDSLHDCFVRELADGARPFDPDPLVLASPSDGIVGAAGSLDGVTALQIKGMEYSIAELFGDPELARPYRDGRYVTLRLTSAMYHRFHAPADATVTRLDYLSGDCWNVNPVALARVQRLFCRNERAVLSMTLARGGHRVALVPVAAVLVASMRFRFSDIHLHLNYDGPTRIRCDERLRKGDEIGHFEHGSTIIVFAPQGFEPCVASGERIRAGQPLMRVPG